MQIQHVGGCCTALSRHEATPTEVDFYALTVLYIHDDIREKSFLWLPLPPYNNKQAEPHMSSKPVIERRSIDYIPEAERHGHQAHEVACQEPRSEPHRECLGTAGASRLRKWAAVLVKRGFEDRDPQELGQDPAELPPKARREYDVKNG